MTMENEFAKRDWIAQLWEETRHDAAAREFIFGEVMEGIRDELNVEVRNEVEDEIRDEIEEDVIANPSDKVLEEVREGILGDLPHDLEDRIKDKLRESIRDEFEDKIAAHERTISLLEAQKRELRAELKAAKVAK